MKEKTSDGQIIIVLTEHPVLGILLIPYIAERLSDNTLQLVEQAFHASAEAMSRMSEAERQAIDIASHYTEKYLMGVYSREKTVSRFLHKLSEDPERIKNNVRPFIEKKLQEMLTLIREKKLALYQKQGGSKLLYAHHAYHVHPHDAEVRFMFQVDENTFRYQLQGYYKGEPFSLSEQKPVNVLTSMPATLSLGMELYFFPNIESSRLLPFTKKEVISVTTSETEKYIDNILIPIARYHEIKTKGLNLIEKKQNCEAMLIIENTIYDKQFSLWRPDLYSGQQYRYEENHLPKRIRRDMLFPAKCQCREKSDTLLDKCRTTTYQRFPLSVIARYSRKNTLRMDQQPPENITTIFYIIR